MGVPAERLLAFANSPAFVSWKDHGASPLSQASEHSPRLAAFPGLADVLGGSWGFASQLESARGGPGPGTHYGRLPSLGGVGAQPSRPAVRQMFE